MTTKISTTNIQDTALTTLLGPKVTTIVYPGTETATDTAGGETINLTGNGFQSGCSVLVASTSASVVTFISSTQISFTAPAQSAGTYVIYVINPDGGTAISIPGISYSGTPNWTTTAGSLGTAYEAGSISATLTATGDAPITYVLATGTLPTGSSLASNGTLSGTAPATASITTYNFTITAKDAQNQTTNRSFSLTINPDVVTWSSPADNSTTTVYEYSAITPVTLAATSAAGKSITYTANSLPTGITLSGSSISGSPTTVGSSSTLLTGTSATTNKTATRTVNFVVNQDVVTWNSPADNTTTTSYTNSAIANVTMSATSAAGRSITYTANALPTGLSIIGANITGTPTVAASSSSLITATASTTNRTATRTFNWVISVANDTYFKNTTLLLNGETTVTPFISDASSNSLGLTIVGDTKPVLFSPYQGDGYYGVYFDGSSSLSASYNSVFNLSTNNFTIEMWVYFTSTAAGSQIAYGYTSSGSNASWALYVNATATLSYYLSSNGTSWNLASGVSMGTIVANKYMHVALVRNGTTVTPYIDGVAGTTTSVSGNSIYNGSWPITIGGLSSYFLTGYISNFRIVNGTAVYTSAFTPSTTPLTAIANTALLTCQSNRFIDKSSNAFTLTLGSSPQISPAIPFTANSSYSTYGSGLFPTDTGADYLRLPASISGLTFTADFTLEFWVYVTGAEVRHFFGSTTSGKCRLYVNGGYLQIYSNGSGTNLNAAGAWPNNSSLLNQWVHIAISRTGSNLYFFVNGVSKTITVSAGAVTDTLDFDNRSYIGTYDATKGFQGYMADFRAVKGTGVYSSNFTPPTSPLTAITNTSLLTLQYNGGANNYGIIDNSNFNNIITRVGNTSQGSFSPYSVTGWSNYIPTANDWITVAMTSNQQSYGFRGSFTVEFWMYLSAIPASGIGYIFISGRGGANYLTLYMNTSGYIVYAGSSSGTRITANTAYVPGTWTHVAVSRTAVFGSSGLVKMFINGVQQTTTYNDGGGDNWNIGTSSYIGGDGNGSYTWPAYYSNLRVVTGTSLYNSAFTPPTSPLTAVTVAPVASVNAETQMVICQSNRFIDNGPNNLVATLTGTPSVQAFSPFGSITEATPTSYSNYIDGTSNVNLLTPASSALVLGSNNWTIEAWIYLPVATGSSSTFYIASNRYLNDAQNGSGPLITILNQKLYIRDAGAALYNTQPTTLSINTWYHIAVCRSGYSIYSFINGVQEGTTFTYGTAPTYACNQIAIGYDANFGLTSVVGYISNLRVVNGTALYTTGFTPSTTPLTAITNTSLLTCQSPTVVDNSVNKLTFTTAGAPKPSKINPFGYTAQSATSYTPSLHGGSIYLGNTTDYISTTLPSAPRTGSFTMEAWIYPNGTGGGTYKCIFDTSTTGAYAGQVGLSLDSSNKFAYNINGSSATGIGSVVSNNVWSHVAISYIAGSGGYIYLNGALQGSYTGNTSFDYTSAGFNVGRMGYWGTSYTFGGYISDVRVTLGKALYTSNFVPPTQTLGNYSTTYPSSLLLNFTNGGIVDQHGSNVLETVGNTQLSTSVKKYNVASMSFNGSNQNLLFPYTSLHHLPGDFTIEFWMYWTSSSNGGMLINKGGGLNIAYASYEIYMDTVSGNIRFAASTTNSSYDIGGESATGNMGVVTVNTWTHVAVTRSGSTFRGFVNGVQGFTATSTSALYDTSPRGLAVGSNYGTTWGTGTPTASFAGYIDDLRITKGVARYTSNFTAPTSALITK
jgi:hypothetical protein